MKRLREFDVLKGLSITAVILIHVTSHGVGTFDPTSTSYFVYLILNRLSQFAVPTFISQAASPFIHPWGRLSKYDHRKLKPSIENASCALFRLIWYGRWYTLSWSTSSQTAQC